MTYFEPASRGDFGSFGDDFLKRMTIGPSKRRDQPLLSRDCWILESRGGRPATGREHLRDGRFHVVAFL
jgi:hypothetical protein